MGNTGPTGAKIKVLGVGGGGGNAINNMIRSGLEGVEFIAANTDFQALDQSLAPVQIEPDQRTGGRGQSGDGRQGNAGKHRPGTGSD
jgi:cell division protein FtsZ